MNPLALCETLISCRWSFDLCWKVLTEWRLLLWLLGSSQTQKVSKGMGGYGPIEREPRMCPLEQGRTLGGGCIPELSENLGGVFPDPTTWRQTDHLKSSI